MQKRVIIPKSSLRQRLDEAAALKTEASALLRELEGRATGRPSSDKPGGWRHDPLGWWRRRMQ